MKHFNKTIKSPLIDLVTTFQVQADTTSIKNLLNQLQPIKNKITDN